MIVRLGYLAPDDQVLSTTIMALRIHLRIHLLCVMHFFHLTVNQTFAQHSFKITSTSSGV